MPAYDYTFVGGSDAVNGAGDRWVISFGGTWIADESWSIDITSSEGDITVGTGNIGVKNITTCFTYRRRVFLGLQSQWNFSDNDDATGWEQQNPGAGLLVYLSDFGNQDLIVGFGQMQGRLVVFAGRSIQIWAVDADPANFSLQQVLDNIGALSALSIQQLGDSDVLFLDPTGVRSLRSREVTLNAYVDDIGSPIDDFIRAALVGFDASGAPGAVEPTTKNFWLFVKDTIYVLSRHPSAKITAWSTYEPRGDDNTLFTPQKFVVYQERVYCRSTQRGHYLYGGSNNNTFDPNSQVTVKTPYLDDKKPGVNKIFNALSTVQEGAWTHGFATDPQSDSYVAFPARGSTATPNEKTDSTYDIGVLRSPAMRGTHVSVKSISNNQSTSLPAVLGQLLVYYNLAEMS